MSQSTSAPSLSSSSNNNNNNNGHQQKPLILNLENDDDDDDDDVVFLEKVQKTLPPTPVCLVKTGGPLDYREDCFCVRCRLIKEFLAKLECEPDCLCEDCREAAEARQNGTAEQEQEQQLQAHNGNVVNDGANEVEHPQASLEQTNSAQPEALSPESDDDDRNSKCSTPDYNPRIFSDDEAEEEDEREHEDAEKMDERESKDTNHGSAKSCSKFSASFSAINKQNAKASTNPNKCPFCQSRANSSSSLSTHYRVAHLSWKPYYCKWDTNCAFTSGYLKAVEAHIKWKHLRTSTTRTINKHIAVHYVGNRDDHQPPTDTLLSEYLLKTTGIKWPVTTAIEPSLPERICPKCGRRFARPDFLECHLESHGSSGFVCIWPNCGQFYTTCGFTAAKKHICHDHMGTRTEYYFKDRKLAKKYLQPVSASNTDSVSTSSIAKTDFQITQPTTSFATTNQYDNDADVNVSSDESDHRSLDKQPEPTNGQFKCRHCSKCFPNKTRFKVHVIIHTGNRPFECARCSYKSNRETNVAHHFRTVHNGKRLFRCKFAGCSYSKSKYTDVTKHIQIAHSAVALKCGGLKKGFKKYIEKRYLAPKRK